MRVTVEFQDERLDLEVPEGRLTASWRGPSGIDPGELPALVADAVENPRDYPPLRQAVVPGDRVVIALGHDVPEAPTVLASLLRVLEGAGVDPGSISILSAQPTDEALTRVLPGEVTFLHHDPEDRASLAYLATTAEGRRVYLNRALTDADFVLPVGRLAYDPVLGYQGPWEVIYPGMSDAETRREFRARSASGVAAPDAIRPGAALKESAEVSWLLGSQFQVGVVAGVSGVVEAVAGLGSSVLEEGGRKVDASWGFHPSSRAELVIAGVGRPGETSGIDDVARGLDTAMRLVRRGGKIVLLSRAEGPLGPAVQCLSRAEDPRSAAATLKGHEAEGDYPVAVRLARALAWADVYLLSSLGGDAVEDLSMIALDRPEEARRLAAVSGTCLVVSHADLAHASVEGEVD